MEFIDLAAQQRRIREKIEENMRTVLDHGKYVLGPEVPVLEERLAEYVGARHAVSCASGTDALLMALMAHNVGPGDAVFTTPFTFVATAEVISLLGATPVFVDVEPRTFNIDPNKLEQAVIAVKNSDSTSHPLPFSPGMSPLNPRGIIPVDLFGLPADYDIINDIAQKHGLSLVEDAAQSFGAEYHGRKACSFGDVACTSFFPAKPLGCYGDGGMCFADDGRIAELLKSIRVHGQGNHRYENIRIGINGRLDTLQAAILLAKFEVFPEEIELRQEAAGLYNELLKAEASLITPAVPHGLKSVWAQYSLLAKDEDHRSTLQARLKDAGIPTAIYYPKPLHLQTAFASLGYKKGDFPVSENCASRIFSLPMHPYLKREDQEKIAEIILT